MLLLKGVYCLLALNEIAKQRKVSIIEVGKIERLSCKHLAKISESKCETCVRGQRDESLTRNSPSYLLNVVSKEETMKVSLEESCADGSNGPADNLERP
nr:hypothetical transcript [Hymenolepis microstoma]